MLKAEEKKTISIDHINCGICGGCVAVCPQLALELAAQYLILHSERCNLCGICIKMCPLGCINMNSAEKAT